MKARVAPRVVPRFMREPVAAEYLGISRSYLRTLAIPRRRMATSVVGYLREDLDVFLDGLPEDTSEAQGEVAKCDEIFLGPNV